ncbi:hydroxymethylbilane synthase, partial [Spirillospora sp. NPDC048823]|uniref:hydroxymethylbilane synthase n=1 Tax=unclassified Spirillospora TaxID=2642701 RepID=UPI0037147C95
MDSSSPLAPAAAYFEKALPGRALRLGGRTSHLARAYARRVIDTLAAVVPGLDIEYVPIETSADRYKGDLSELGGKGLFMKEIDKALMMGHIDAAVHCMKDVPGDVHLPKEFVFAAYLQRDDVRDAVVFPDGSKYAIISDLPPGARIGTSAVRRKAQLLRRRPDLNVQRFRGNVIPRLTRLDEEQQVDALVLAGGGLTKVGMEHRISQLLSLDEMCPAIGAFVAASLTRKNARSIIAGTRLHPRSAVRRHTAVIAGESPLVSAVRRWFPGLAG